MNPQENIQPIKNSSDWFLSKLYLSNKPDHEVIRILQTLNRYIKITYKRDIFYTIEIINEDVIRFKPLNDLADDCLITTSLFIRHIKYLYKYHAAPHPNWYIKTGRYSFEKLGHYDIAKHYEFWMDFLREHIFS